MRIASERREFDLRLELAVRKYQMAENSSNFIEISRVWSKGLNLTS